MATGPGRIDWREELFAVVFTVAFVASAVWQLRACVDGGPDCGALADRVRAEMAAGDEAEARETLGEYVDAGCSAERLMDPEG